MKYKTTDESKNIFQDLCVNTVLKNILKNLSNEKTHFSVPASPLLDIVGDSKDIVRILKNAFLTEHHNRVGFAAEIDIRTLRIYTCYE